MEAPRRPEPSLVGAGGRRRAQPRDVGDCLASSSVPDRGNTQGPAGALPSGSAISARGLGQETAGISSNYS
jgi:hypothetical protein